MIMMIDWTKISNFYVACGYTDMRRQIDGLASIVETQFGMELAEDSLFLFCGKRADRLKALYWDGEGYILLYKRLSSSQKFQWPRKQEDLLSITQQQFRWLLEGLSIEQKKAIKRTKQPTLF